MTVGLLDLLEVLLYMYWRLATALAGHPRCAWRHSERAKLNHVLHLRDLSEKKEGFHVLIDAMAASSAMGRFRRRFWAGQRTPGPQRSPRWLRICCNHFGC